MQCHHALSLQEAQREQEEKHHSKHSEAPEEDERRHHNKQDEAVTEVEAARGNSVFAAPVSNLAAGVQLGFTPSSAGDPFLLWHCIVLYSVYALVLLYNN